MSKKAKIILSVLIIIIILPLAVWGVSLLKCEILTSLHGEEFTEVYRENTMMGDIEYLKVLDYSDSSARVYYVSHDYLSGDVLTFSNENGEWKYESWERTVWSKTGSADGFLWPYITDTLVHSLKMFKKIPEMFQGFLIFRLV